MVTEALALLRYNKINTHMMCAPLLAGDGCDVQRQGVGGPPPTAITTADKNRLSRSGR
jgi:hypothetical protein